MIWIISLNIAMLLCIAIILVSRVKVREKAVPSPVFIEPPQVYSNLPMIEKVDIYAFLKKWED
jgi:hypothetical protein